MKLISMTATFGCLDGARLDLTDGLNVLVRPNESGKTTWAAFLTAMLYGIDTSQRAVKGKLPDKIRYQPWNGKPMEGVIELEHEGRIMVLQRTSRRGKPFGEFRAWDRDTGLEVPGITGENCGLRLLGVERAVFCRSAFLSGGDLTVTRDEDLARRLSSLAATGREDDSRPQAEARLKLWQNRIRYHKTGLLPEAEDQLAQVRELQTEVENLRRQRLETLCDLERTERDAKNREYNRKLLQRNQEEQLKNALKQAEQRANDCAEQTSALPSEEELRRLQGKLEALIPTEAGLEPPCPPALAGLTAEEVWPRAQADAARYEVLTSGKLLAMPIVFLIYAAVLLTAGIICAVLNRWIGAGVCAALTVMCLILWAVKRKKDRHVLADRKAAKAILAAYEVKTKDALLTAAVERRDWLRQQAVSEQQLWERDLILEQIRDFAPETETAADAYAALDRAVDLHKSDRQARKALEQARIAWETRQAPSDPEIEPLRRRCAALQAEAAALLRQEDALGSWERLEARAQALETKIADLTEREQALILAREALASADAQLTRVYAPQLTKLAGSYIDKLTDGRYDGLIMEEGLTLSARESATGLVRPLSALSRGTQDQTWLALRLAMTRLLLPEDAPILLDDALLTFDRQREQAAVEVLKNENRQVILFTCR